MSAAGAIKELEIRIDRLASAGATYGDFFLHSIDVERALELFSTDDPDLVAWVRRNENLRFDSNHLYVGGVGHLDRQRPLGCAEGVGIKLRSFISLANYVDDAEEAHRLAGRHL
ncbi:MAG: hypothetical protein AAF368_13785, partial [Planctomycetota bacterium]